MKRRKIDYYKKNLVNPFFRRKKRKRLYISKYSMSRRVKLITMGIIVLIITLIWLFCFSAVFNINKIKIKGLTRISNQEIENLIWQQTKNNRFLFIAQNNLIIFSKTKLIETLNKNYYFEKIIVSKRLPNILIVNIQEKSYAFIWHEADKYYYTDIDGYIINEINPLEIKQKKYPLIHNKGENKIIKNKINIDNIYINYIINLFNEFSVQDKDDLKIEKFIIDKDINTIKMVLVGGPTIYFNIKESQEKQINKLFIIKNEKIKDDFRNKSYIDLRYGDRVYYR